MTTPDLPEAAVEAVAREMGADYDHGQTEGELCVSCLTRAAEYLTAALPHLGETAIQFGVQYRDRDGDTMTMQCSGLLDAEHEAKNFDTAAAATIVHRPRITGPWTPWTGGTR